MMRPEKYWPKQPVSRVLYPQPVTRRRAMVIHLGVPLPTPSSNQPGSTDGPSLTLPYLVLLLVGFTWHPASPSDPVSSYLTLSPLPAFRLRQGYGGPCRQGCGRRSSLCGTFPGVTPAGRYPASCPVEPGLSSQLRAAICTASAKPITLAVVASGSAPADSAGNRSGRPRGRGCCSA